MDPPLIDISLNGSKRSLSSGTTILGLLEQLNIDPQIGGIAVAIGFHVIPRSRWAETLLTDGDEIEIIRATAGG